MASINDSSELNDTQKLSRAVIIASFSVTGAFVALRCWIRARVQGNFSIDDYLLVIALMLFTVQTSFGIYAIDQGGFGRKTANLSPDVYATGLKWTALTQCFYTLALMFAKLSIALLQLRVMGFSTATLRRMHYGSVAVVALVSVYEFVTLLFQCHPARPGPDGRPLFEPVLVAPAARADGCASRTPILVGGFLYSAANIALDWYYSLAMVPLIWRLQTMRPVVKASAIVMLGMGFVPVPDSASIATIIRLKYLVNAARSHDPLVAIVPVALWSWVEECLGMCAACVANFRPLLRLIPALMSSAGRGRNGEQSGSCSRRAGGGGGGDDASETGDSIVSWRGALGCPRFCGGRDGDDAEEKTAVCCSGGGSEKMGRPKGERLSGDGGVCGNAEAAPVRDELDEAERGEYRGRDAVVGRDPGRGVGIVEYVVEAENDTCADADAITRSGRYSHHIGFDGSIAVMAPPTVSSGKGDDLEEVRTVPGDEESQKSMLRRKHDGMRGSWMS